jgi:NAD(P)-dependent dehydrogenase (short-subunit alcohol dehydrogenase family)
MKLSSTLHDCTPSTDPRVNESLRKALRGKFAIVVGSGRGIGRACCEFFAHATVQVIACIALEESEAQATAARCREINPSSDVVAAGVDVRDYAATRDLFAKLEQRFGRTCDVLLMNAGLPGQWLPTSQADPENWWDTVSVSLKGAFNCARLVLPGMQAKKDGRIIFTSSIGAHYAQGMSGYGVAKLGQVRLAEIIHEENYKQYNVKCFAYHPGCVKTRFYTDFEDAVLGKVKSEQSGNYASLKDGVDLETARTAYEALKGQEFDTEYMAAGLVTAVAAGQLDFMSGRYLDASVDVERYISTATKIQAEDLCRVRLNQGDGDLLPNKMTRH